MDRRNVTDHPGTVHPGTVHEGLLNSYDGSLIGFTCGARHHDILRLNSMPDPAHLTEAPATCTGCRAAVTGETPHPADVARECADAVLADADRRGYPPSLDDEGLRLAFVRLTPDSGELRPVFERLARGVYDPENSYRAEPLYPLIKEHLADWLTERALKVPEGTPKVLVEYTRHTGGTVQVPVGVGDRLMRCGVASGIWYTATVTAIETSGVTVQDKDGWTRRWDRHDFHHWFFKLDRAPLPAELAA